MTAAATDNLPRAIGGIVLATFALSLGDALIKRFSGDTSLWQIFVLRSAIALPVVVALLKIRAVAVAFSPPTAAAATAAFIPHRPGWTTARSFMLAFMWAAYYAALPRVPLSVAAAVFYTTPLFIPIFAAWFLGDRVGARRWCAILLGFAGMLLIVRPDTGAGAGAFNGYALLPLVSAVLYALAMVITRARCAAEHPLTLALHLNLALIVVGGGASVLLWMTTPGAPVAPVVPVVPADSFLLANWHAPGAQEWGILTVLAAAVIIGAVGAAIAYQSAPPATVAPFDYSYLLFAALWGFTLFAETPTPTTLAGMLLITTGGMLVLRR